MMGRDCVGRMREASEQDGFDAAKFETAAKEFVPLLRQHIFKENNILFKMAENVLSTADDDALNDRFTEVERERKLSDLHQQFAAEVAQWEEAMT